jgi:hypothetical protein
MRKWAQNSPVNAGVALVLAGFVALFLAWNGASGIDYVEGQLPYLLSGGLVGLGLIGAGLTVVNVQARRQDQAELLAHLQELTDLLRDEAEAEPTGRARLQAAPEAPTPAPAAKKPGRRPRKSA